MEKRGKKEDHAERAGTTDNVRHADSHEESGAPADSSGKKRTVDFEEEEEDSTKARLSVVETNQVMELTGEWMCEIENQMWIMVIGRN